ncbi:MAG: PilZ domain-containing protein [Terriglobales bacterium]
MSRSRRVALAPPRVAQRFAHYRELSIVYEGASLDIPVRAPDISTRGMFINTAQKFPEGAVLRICFRLSRTNCVVTARGEVRYCLPGVGIGVEFIGLPEDSQRAIEEEAAGATAEAHR